ncbi:MAG: formylglycine-generating enzyme family protein [Leptolyngbya sp. SIO1E4]|nr:formylglycine-generating enzyme family protein [Leptolyngbya sp. SIO1E4]
MANTSQKRYPSTAPRLSIARHKTVAQHFIEKLSDGIDLDMVLIQGSTFLAGMSLVDENAPNGTFLMGSPENELERYDDEGPQHEVTVPTFFMGKFPITQAQWRIVAATYPQAQRSLDPNPAHFKGDNRPVESVSWYDAVEFCTRLSQKTGRTYRLPSEAEWEYACRAGTNTPFHCGETITTDLANYNGDKYGRGPEGKNREETTDVGSLSNPNAFGLYDIHGNVWEWCLDHWHNNYEGNPPTDGSAWLFSSESGESDRSRVLRGSSWYSNPRDCRSACRDNDLPAERFNNNGFRVVCSAA